MKGRRIKDTGAPESICQLCDRVHVEQLIRKAETLGHL
jgi:hypothetical protein